MSKSKRLNVELPFFSKFLLLAAFLASYNPAKTDKRFFMTQRAERVKEESSKSPKERYK
jgi:origin recognition complex subunit 5